MNKDSKYIILSIGTSVADTLVEVKNNFPTALVEQSKFFALDTNRDIKTYEDKGVTPIMFGEEGRKGKGCGLKPELGKAAFLESKDDISQQICDDAEKIEAAIIFVAPGRGGTSGALLDLCLLMKEKGIPIVLFIFEPSEFAFEAGPLQVSQFKKVREELIQHNIKFFQLNQDWTYKIENTGHLPLREVRRKMHTEVAKAIAKVAMCWLGGVLDRADLEEQILAGAGNIKIAEVSYDPDPARAEASITEAFNAWKGHDLYKLDGPVKIAVSFLDGQWLPEHNKYFCKLLDAFCKSTQPKEEDDSESIAIPHGHKQVDLADEGLSNSPMATAGQEDPWNSFPWSKSQAHILPAAPSKMGRLALLVSTVISVKAERPVMEILENHLPSTGQVNGHAAVAMVSSLSPLQLVGKAAAAPHKLAKLTKEEQDLAQALKLSVYKELDDPMQWDLGYLVDRMVYEANIFSKTVLQEWEPEKFFRILNHLRRTNGVSIDYRFSWDEFSKHLQQFAHKDVIFSLESNYNHWVEILCGKAMDEGTQKRIWLFTLLSVAQSADLVFPSFKMIGLRGNKVQLHKDMTAVDLANLEACPAESHQRNAIVQARCLKTIFGTMSDGIWKSSAGGPSKQSWFSPKKIGLASITRSI